MLLRSLRDLLPTVVIDVVDVGANPIDGDPPYRALMAAGAARVVGFEPNPQALASLQARQGPGETYLPHALGDGSEQTLHVCRAPGMTSILRPNVEILRQFHGFAQWGEVIDRVTVQTRRLDDVVAAADFLKLDVQGYELEILRHATLRLADALVIHAETNFLPMYVDQPLFSDIEQFLRQHGFRFHRFAALESRTIQPMLVDGGIYSGLSQIFWADSVFVRDFTSLQTLAPGKLLKLALIMHDVYGSYDLALRALMAHDELSAGTLAPQYVESLSLSVYPFSEGVRNDPRHERR